MFSRILIFILFANIIFSQTIINSDITSNTIWSISGSPYIIQSSITIHEGAKLTINPGVIIKFNLYTTLIVKGTLNALGNSSNNIIFTVNSTAPKSGDWHGLEFESTSRDCILKFCTIEYANKGIYCSWGASPQIENCTIKDSKNENIYLYVRANAIIKNCTIKYSKFGHGIYVGSSSPIIENCQIINNGINSSYNKAGIYVYSTSIKSFPEIIGNHIQGSSFGIYCTGNAKLKNNKIVNNENTGIVLSVVEPYSDTIIGNEIKNNETGLTLSGTDYAFLSPVIKYNTIENNNIGIDIRDYAKPQINNNNLVNITYDIVNGTSSNINAKSNWWGYSTTLEMNSKTYPDNISKIYDYYDAYWYGIVEYQNWLSSPVYFGPEPFALISPTDSQRVETHRPSFNWEGTTDPTGDPVTYTLYYDTIPTFTTPTIISGLNTTSYTPLYDLNDNTIYYWKVSATDGENVTWSNQTNWKFSINLSNDSPKPFSLISPEDSSNHEPLQPTFKWEEASDPDPFDSITYTLWYDTNSTFSTFIEITGLTKNEYTPPTNLKDNTIYYWKVKATDSYGVSVWSIQTNWLFVVNSENEAPLPFSSISPQNDSMLATLFPTFKWEATNDPDPFDTVYYKLYIDTSTDFENPIIYDSLNSTSFTIQDTILNDNTHYYWKVGAVDKEGVITWCNKPFPHIFINLFNDPPQIINLPDTISFAMDTTYILHIWDYVYDPETPDSLLSYEFNANSDSLKWRFQSNSGKIELFVDDNFLGNILFYISVLDDSNAIATDSIMIVIQSPTHNNYKLVSNAIPNKFSIKQNFPNPFNSSTTIQFSIPYSCYVEVEIYNTIGKKIRTLIHENKVPGYYEVVWDGKDDQGKYVASGIYLYQLKTKKFTETKKMILIR